MAEVYVEIDSDINDFSIDELKKHLQEQGYDVIEKTAKLNGCDKFSMQAIKDFLHELRHDYFIQGKLDTASKIQYIIDIQEG